MKVNIDLSGASVEKLVKQVVVLIDTREQENNHIIQYLDKKGIAHQTRKLDQGDYSAILKANAELGLPFDVSLEKEIAIERKGSSGNGLTEIAGNFTTGRQAFENEFIRAAQNVKNFYLIVENGSWESINAHKYRSEMNPKALYNSLISWRRKYGFHIDFVQSDNVGEHIMKLISATLKKMLEE